MHYCRPGRNRGGLVIFMAFGLLLAALFSCSVQKQIGRSAKETVLGTDALKTAHVGISIYEPETNKYWYDHQGDKYFVPASNTKIPTCYAAMKYLGDSLAGLRYQFMGDNLLLIQATADPTFLHPDYRVQPVYDFLQQAGNRQIILCDPRWQDDAYGSGWSWNDYQSTYMAERSVMPIYGNIARFIYTGRRFTGIPKYFVVPNDIVDGDVAITYDSIPNTYGVERRQFSNSFFLTRSNNPVQRAAIPFITATELPSLLKDTLKKSFAADYDFHLGQQSQIIRSQPTDSLLTPMMHRSDNFFAEQTLLMVSNKLLDLINDATIIDTLLKTDFRDLPQPPRWADGSGLSRYNLFTPQDFVSILHKMKNEFGIERIKTIFPTGGEGTLSSYYKPDSGYIYAKTGTLSGVVALSGYLYTKKNKLLIFSVLVNNHQASATDIRRAVEKFVRNIRQNH